MSVLAAARPGILDAELLSNVAAGDLSALGILFDRHAADVRRFIGRLGVGLGELDDLTQGTFLLAIDVAGGFRGEASARAWLLGLAANLVRRRRRSVARLTARLAAWARERTTDPPAITPERSCASREQLETARRALERLSPKKREIFVMVVLEGVSAADAARALDIPVGTVFTRLHHARREIRDHFAALEASE